MKSKFPCRRIFRLAGCLAAGMVYAAQAAATSCPPADTEALQWLEKMSRSAQEVSYHGVVTFQRGDDMQVMQISHSVSGGTASERLTQLTGQGAQVTRTDHPLECLHPGHRLLRLGATDAATGSSLSGSCGIAENYRFSVDEGERVAGRKAVRILIAPRDMYRYGYVMELDRQTGLLLKAQTIGRGNKVLERFQFANLSYDEEVSQAPDVEVLHNATHSLPEEHTGAGHYSEQWTVRWLPNGFTATDSPAGAGKRRTYTDGLAVFSVFLEVLPQDIKPGEGVARRGGTTSYTRGMRLAGRPTLVTVIGEVPVNTARMVADSIKWSQEP